MFSAKLESVSLTDAHFQFSAAFAEASHALPYVTLTLRLTLFTL
jgi:hypothetical protein